MADDQHHTGAMKAGVVTWNTAVKLALTFMMVSAFVVAYLF